MEYKHLVIPKELHTRIRSEATKNNTTMTRMLSVMFSKGQ